MMIFAVNQRHGHRLIGQPLSGVEAAKTAADDNNSWAAGLFAH
jgi:hypothetical protein